METLKRWFGWGAQAAEEDKRKQEDQQAGQWPHKRPVVGATAARQAPLLSPVVCDRPSGDGGIQGLDWFRHSMLRDTDGDCAHSFMEEEAPRCQVQQMNAAAAQLEPQGGSHEHDGQQRRRQQQHQAALQCTSSRARQAGPSDMLVERGNVYVVPHNDGP